MKSGVYTPYQNMYVGLCHCPDDYCTCPLCSNEVGERLCKCQRESKVRK